MQLTSKTSRVSDIYKYVKVIHSNYRYRDGFINIIYIFTVIIHHMGLQEFDF